MRSYNVYKMAFFVITVQVFLSLIGIIFNPKKGIDCIIHQCALNDELANEIDALNETIAQTNAAIDLYTQDDFVKEKIAREELQMARPTEYIFFVHDNSFL